MCLVAGTAFSETLIRSHGFVGSELVLWQIRTFSLYWSSGGPPASHGPRESPGSFAR